MTDSGPSRACGPPGCASIISRILAEEKKRPENEWSGERGALLGSVDELHVFKAVGSSFVYSSGALRFVPAAAARVRPPTEPVSPATASAQAAWAQGQTTYLEQRTYQEWQRKVLVEDRFPASSMWLDLPCPKLLWESNPGRSAV